MSRGMAEVRWPAWLADHVPSPPVGGRYCEAAIT